MSLARVKNWIAEVLTYSDLNAEFNNILNNPSSLICPITFHLTFTDATYDIGASGATRPRDLFLSRNATIGGTLAISGTGPHAIGGATDAGSQLNITGSFSGASYAIGQLISSTLTPLANNVSYGLNVSVTLNKAGSGTHADFVGLFVNPPTIGAGAAALTNATTLKITGAPSTGTNKYSFWCISTVVGDIRLDSSSANGSVATVLGSVGPTGSQTTVQEWLTVNIGGNVRYIPAF